MRQWVLAVKGEGEVRVLLVVREKKEAGLTEREGREMEVERGIVRRTNRVGVMTDADKSILVSLLWRGQ